MASATSPADLQPLLECSICLNQFQDPRVLPCLHSYCLKCLESHVATTKDSDRAFLCPQCREKCVLPDGGVNGFPKNFFVNAMKDMLSVPASLDQDKSAQADRSPNPPVCKHHSDDSGDKHGAAVIFCIQCDAHFCQTCSKHHGKFTKDHEVLSVDGTIPVEKNKPGLCCELHGNQPINWYCKTCLLPACSDCIIEKHDGHSKERLAATEAVLKQEMLDVSQLAAKRMQALQKISADLDANKTKMKADLSQASKDISETADSICTLVRTHEAALQKRVNKAGEEANNHFIKAQEALDTSKTNTSNLKMCADNLQKASSEKALYTTVKAPLTKQQFLHQQEVPVSYVQWSEGTSYVEHQLPGPQCVGTLEIDTSIQSKSDTTAEDFFLDEPAYKINAELSGSEAVCGIAPIKENMLCVAQYFDKDILIYNKDGSFVRKISIPNVDSISGILSPDSKNNKIVVVDRLQSRVHFVDLSPDVEIERHHMTNTPLVASRITQTWRKELVVNTTDEKRLVVLTSDGKVKHDVKVQIPHPNVCIRCVAQTRCGYALCDRDSRKVYFTDEGGEVLQTATNCTNPRSIHCTSWGHVLVPDQGDNDIKMYSSTGDYLGSIREKNKGFECPYWVCVDEAEKLLYLGCGPAGKYEIRVYNVVLSELPFEPLPLSVTTLTANLSLAKV